eukprot:gene51563-27412_t
MRAGAAPRSAAGPLRRREEWEGEQGELDGVSASWSCSDEALCGDPVGNVDAELAAVCDDAPGSPADPDG